MESILTKAIDVAQNAQVAYSKYITPNDVGKTNSHQYGFHIHKSAWKLMFDSPRIKGSNDENLITIKWQDDFETASRFIYYGTGTRNEYRLTRFGQNFPFLTEDNLGDLLVICKIEEKFYQAYILNTDEDIEDFLAALNISPDNVNGIIPKQFEIKSEDGLLVCFDTFIKTLANDFPSTFELSTSARNCYNNAFRITASKIKANPDKELIKWLEVEFQLFKLIENSMYLQKIERPFSSVEELINVANTILNRRKSRAGKSLEHHLEAIFNIYDLAFSSQKITEGNKKPDFIFPSIEAYHNSNFDNTKLVMLASKTTCKDRWRQILNEADRIKTKHLFTLQQGISKRQLTEMYDYNVCLVIPKNNLESFPVEFHSKILTLNSFISSVQTT